MEDPEVSESSESESSSSDDDSAAPSTSESILAAESIGQFLGILYRSYGYSALVLAVLLSFLPVLLLLESNGEEISYSSMAQAYGWANAGFSVNQNRKVTELRQMVFEQNADLSKIMEQARLAELYRQRYESLKEKGLSITTELLEHRGREETLRKELQKQSLALYEKSTTSQDTVKKLNATYIRAFTEMKRRLTKLQEKNKRQVQVNEMLEKKLEALRESNGVQVDSSAADDAECIARVKKLEAEIRRLKNGPPAAKSEGNAVQKSSSVHNSAGKAVDVIDLGPEPGEEEVVPSKYRSTINSIRNNEPHAQVIFDGPNGGNVAGSTGGRYSRQGTGYDNGMGAIPGMSRQDAPRNYAPANPLADYGRYGTVRNREVERNTNRFMPNNCNRRAFEYNVDMDGDSYFETPVTSARTCLTCIASSCPDLIELLQELAELHANRICSASRGCMSKSKPCAI